jgi:hypothetical protein
MTANMQNGSTFPKNRCFCPEELPYCAEIVPPARRSVLTPDARPGEICEAA